MHDNTQSPFDFGSDVDTAPEGVVEGGDAPQADGFAADESGSASNGDTVVTSPETPKSKTVPYERFQRVNAKARQAELDLARMQAQLDMLQSYLQQGHGAKPEPDTSEIDDAFVDPFEKELRATKSELEQIKAWKAQFEQSQEQARLQSYKAQLQSELAEASKEYPLAGVADTLVWQTMERYPGITVKQAAQHVHARLAKAAGGPATQPAARGNPRQPTVAPRPPVGGSVVAPAKAPKTIAEAAESAEAWLRAKYNRGN